VHVPSGNILAGDEDIAIREFSKRFCRLAQIVAGTSLGFAAIHCDRSMALYTPALNPIGIAEVPDIAGIEIVGLGKAARTDDGGADAAPSPGREMLRLPPRRAPTGCLQAHKLDADHNPEASGLPPSSQTWPTAGRAAQGSITRLNYKAQLQGSIARLN